MPILWENLKLKHYLYIKRSKNNYLFRAICEKDMLATNQLDVTPDNYLITKFGFLVFGAQN